MIGPGEYTIPLDAQSPSEGMLKWFDTAAVAIQVLKRDGDCEVWVSNGLSGREWEGTRIAVSTTEEDAKLVALALQQMRESRAT